MVVSNSAASCALNSMAKSKIGKLHFNDRKLNQFFGVKDLKLNAEAMKHYFPVFEGYEQNS